MTEKMVKDLLRWWQKSNPEFHEKIIDPENGQTLLHLASEVGYFDIVEELISMGADTNIQDFELYTPLHNCSDIDTMRLLLENGANVNALDKQKTTPLHGACLNGHLEGTELLLENGANIEALNESKESPLYCALKEGHNNVAELLLDKAPQLVNQIVCFDSRTYPIHLVAEQGNEEMLENRRKLFCQR